jgi:uncharacterized protein GlcG (DUF336 family)
MTTENPTPRYARVLTYAEARVILDAGLAEATAIAVPASVAVLDASREIVAFARQDHAPTLTGEVATAKAFTSIALRQRSADLAEAAGAGGIFDGLHHATERRLATFAGGLPLFDGDDIIGAIGASGGTIDEDLRIVGAMLAAFEGLGA